MHGYVEDMELSDMLHKSLEITNALIAGVLEPLRDCTCLPLVCIISQVVGF